MTCWFFILAALLALPAAALDPRRDLGQYNVHTWTRQNGLPVNGVQAIAQDGAGYIWLGTTSGLVRFDGVDFELFDLVSTRGVRSGNVHGLTPARQGGLWVGLGRGFGHFDGQSLTYRGAEADGAADMLVRSIVETDDRALWLACENHALRLLPSGDYEEIVGMEDEIVANVFASYLDARGRVWFATAELGVHVWENGQTTKLPDPDLARFAVTAIAVDREERVWIGGDAGLFRYDAGLGNREIFLEGHGIKALFVDSRGTLWIGTAGSGLYRFLDGELSKPFGPENGLADALVTSFAEDHEGSLWVGTRRGLSQLTDVKFPLIPAVEGRLSQEALSVAPSRRGGIWIGTQSGISYYDGDNVVTMNPDAVSPDQQGNRAGDGELAGGGGAAQPLSLFKRVFEASDGDLYVVSGSNWLVILSPEGRMEALHQAESMVVGMAEDEQGVVVSVAGRLFRASREGLKPYPFVEDEPGMLWILNLTSAPDGAIWVSSVNGIFRVHEGRFEHWSVAQGLKEPAIMGLTIDDDGTVWAATRNGVARLRDGKFHTINRDAGLLANDLFAVVSDSLGFLWVDSDQGIFRVLKADLNAVADGRAERVTCDDFTGPDSVFPTDKRAQERVACTSLDGRIWFPYANGVVVIDPNDIPTNRVPPPVHISRVEANGRPMDLNGDVVVPPGRGQLEFRFAALSYIAPRQVRYRYQLEGYDEGWVETNDRRFATYTNLEPGRYTFRVEAANPDGVWSAAAARQAIDLQPHFHQTVWFRILWIGSLALVFVGVFAARIRLLKNRERQLEESRQRLETEVQNRTAELAGVNESLRGEVDNHKLTAGQLERRSQALEAEIEERTRMQREIELIHRRLLETSRQAGMAEVATGVLHNVGNVLNSVNVSATIVAESVRKLEVNNLARVGSLLRQHDGNLGTFFSTDPKAAQIPKFIEALAEHMTTGQSTVLRELEDLRKNVEHIKDIVAMQQSYAKVCGVAEETPVIELVEDALRMNAGALARHDVTLVREFHTDQVVEVEKHKVLQILVNLIRNAKYACDDSGRDDKRLIVRIEDEGENVRISVIDNGVGIPSENLTRIFSHGFTTRKDGHGFGLHSGALAAKELGGSLTARSEGAGKGAEFELRLPKRKPQEKKAA